MQYLAQRYGTWEWLDLELPLSTDGPEWALSTYGVMYATIAPEIGLAIASDGRPLLEEWGTLVHAEVGEGESSRKWSGIVTESTLNGASWELTIEEFPAYLNGMPLETLIRAVDTDPAQIIRQIWQDVQTDRNSWLGVTVVGETPVRLGSASEDKLAVARSVMDARQATLNSFDEAKEEANTELQDLAATLSDELASARAQVTTAQAYVTTLIAAGAPPAEVTTARATVASRQTLLATLQSSYNSEVNAGKATLQNARTDRDSARAAYDEARDAFDAAKEVVAEDGGAFSLRPEETPDAHQSIIEICDLGGIEWTTNTKLRYGVPSLEVVIHHPKAGTRRDDLVFAQGLNIVSPLVLTRGGDAYANAGIGIGAGEGEKLVRATIGSSSPRLRRPLVFEDKKLKSVGEVSAALRKELRASTGQLYVEEIEVVDHPLAPLFSWNLGDHILIQGNVPHYGEYAALHRVVSWKLKGDNRAVLRLELSISEE